MIDRFNILPVLPVLLALAAACGGPTTRPAIAQPPAGTAAGDAPADAAASAEEDVVEPRLIDRPPYDEITLPAAAGAPLTIRIQPLPTAERPVAGKSFTVEVIRPKSKYPLREITWDGKYEYRSFADLLLAEARALNAAGRDAEAFACVLFIHTNYPDYPGLKEVEDEFLYGETKRLFVGKEYDQALAVVEQLYARDPEFRQTPASPPMSKVLETTAQRYLAWLTETRRYAAARALIERLARAYPELLAGVCASAKDELIGLAETERAAAEIEIEEGNHRAARAALRRMLGIWPEIEGGRDLAQKIIDARQIVLVGVTSTSESARWQNITDWAARRRSVLTSRRLFQFTGFGAEQGEYDFIAGTRELSDDGRHWTLRLASDRPAAQAIGTSYALATALRHVADPAHPDYNPTWARLVDQIEVVGADAVTVHFRQPHVLPQALLQVPLTVDLFPPRYEDDGTDSRAAQLAKLSPYAEESRSAEEVRYVRTSGASRPPAPGGPVATSPVATVAVPAGGVPAGGATGEDGEIVEILYNNRAKMVEDFLRQELDVLDRLLPAEAERLRSTPGVRVGQYELPTVHFLVSNIRSPFLDHRLFRRALIYGLDRDATLQTILSGSRTVDGSRTLSGPFPGPVPRQDTIAYANDEAIKPRPSDPRLAYALKELARQDLQKAAEARGAAAPALTELVLVHPPDPILASAAAALVEQWAPLGVKVKLRALPIGQTVPPDDDWDLLYVEAQVWEPLVDAAKILEPTVGLAKITSPYIDQALWQMEVSRTWSAARPRLLEVHRVSFNELPVLPLWQMMESYAVQGYVQGVPARQYTLYQEAASWRLTAQ